MSTPAFIDTNIFLYAHDRLDREKHETAVRLILDQDRSGTVAIEGSVGILYTEDLQHGAEIDGVRIVNPFTSPQYQTS